MPHIYLCFVWHMHQPFYRDLVSGEYKLPWTRMHALKDYYGMVKVLEDFPSVHQTFNLVPSMMVQIEEYAEGKAQDPFLKAALKPAEELTERERNFILQYFFQANPAKMIYRYPRYGELYDAWMASGKTLARAERFFGAREMRDLQILSQLAWFDEEFLEKDPEIRGLVHKQRDFSLDDQELLGRKQLEVCGAVLPVYSEFAAKGQIEVSTTPFYHPILPLLCDSNIADVAHPHVPLPSRFRYPQDARHQIESAKQYMIDKLGSTPVGMWPSEGSVSDEVFHLAADAGFKWMATDNGVLARTVNQNAGPEITYRPFRWKQEGKEMFVIFRDHFLSDLIGFVYSRMGAAEAAQHFLDRIRENCASILAKGRDALVPVILDGENAWEYYDLSGRPFLRELYGRIAADPKMSAVTVSEGLAAVQAHDIDHIFPGSWINANFDIWIGAEEDNKAWEYLLRARQTYDRVLESEEGKWIPEDRKKLAYEELLIAEGSDWNWWYGPEHDTANRAEFDQLYRDHLANVYLALRLPPPEELSRPILKVAVAEFHEPPSGPVKAKIDGEVTSYFEWLGAGLYKVDHRSGAMHGKRFFVQELRYGSDGQNLFLRLDFVDSAKPILNDTQLRLNIQSVMDPLGNHAYEFQFNSKPDGFEAAFAKVAELRVNLHGIVNAPGQPVRFQLSLWHEGLPMDALPSQGWFELSTAEPTGWGM
jgi:alpha-amylase/alpha-mannosidase (GH57 family)